jgi:HTH-type transcriptional regulator, sugar sensing transcriptional regulator
MLSDLKKIGLTEGEIKVYEALLELGESTKTGLAKKSGVAPSNIYDITNRLIEKGIISKVSKNGVAHFSAANPRHILDFINQKESELDKERNIVGSLLPTLLAQFEKTESSVNVEVFQGWVGLKTVFEDLLQECAKGDHNFVFGASSGEDSNQADRFFSKYTKKRSDKGIVTNIIFNEMLRKRKSRIDFFQKSKKCKVRFLAQTTPSEILLYKNKTCIIILTKEPLVVRITGNEVFTSFKQYFDIMWALAKA